MEIGLGDEGGRSQVAAFSQSNLATSSALLRQF
jgi:hypothetical protein